MDVYKVGDRVVDRVVDSVPYKAYYINSITSNLISFIDMKKSKDLNYIKDFLQSNGLVIFGKAPKIKKA